MKILIPLPTYGFDPTETSVSWKIIHDAGHDVFFATENGAVASPDRIMVTGEGLDPWGFIPGIKRIKLFGLMLRAHAGARAACEDMQKDTLFQNPVGYSDLLVDDYDGVVLPGGHDKSIRPYLESKVLQQFMVDFFEKKNPNGLHKPVGAVCHGVVLLARSISSKTGQSVLHGKKTTALTWSQEKAAWDLTRYFLRFWDPLYYRTYPELYNDPLGYRGVEQEVKRALAEDGDFLLVPEDSPNYGMQTRNLARDSLSDSRPAWVVRDGNYVSARWPGDVHTFAKTYVELLGQQSVDSTDLK